MTMKRTRMLWLLLVLVVCLSVCKQGSSSELEPTPDVPDSLLLKARMLTDSVTFKLSVGQSTTIATDRGELILTITKITDACPQNECSGCDLNGGVFMQLHLKTEEKDLKRIYIPRCSIRGLPILFRTSPCSERFFYPSDYGNPRTTHGNISFFVWEMTPYPATRQELTQALAGNQYTVTLTLINYCGK
jgi:hypothetical protein